MTADIPPPPGDLRPDAQENLPEALIANPNFVFSLLRWIYSALGPLPPNDTKILSTQRGEHFTVTDRVR